MKNDSNIPQVEFQVHKGISFKKGWDMQTDLHNILKENKLAWRHLPEGEKSLKKQLHYVLFCEHSPVYTLGKSGSVDHLLLSEKELLEKGIDYFPINRGGDITYHGPGQITGYPIIDLDDFYHDVKRYVSDLEESIILLLKTYGLEGKRIEGYTGVWLGDEAPFRKICAIGVHMSRWVTLHGFALNVNTDLSYFSNVIPCGIDDDDKTVTSMKQELGYEVDYDKVMEELKEIISNVFGFKYIQ